MISQSITSAVTAHLLFVAAKVRLADVLAQAPQSSDTLGQQLGLHVPTLHRLMCGLVACGVLLQQQDGAFALTPEGEPLRRDHPGSHFHTVIEWGEVIAPALTGLQHALRTGEPPFDHVFGMPIWAYRARTSEAWEAFHAHAAAVTTEIARSLLHAYDFKPFRHIVDVGGGRGAMLAVLLAAHPTTTGTLFDCSVEGAAQAFAAAGVEARATIVAGDFFSQVPQGGDLYLLKSILHDWNDAETAQILANCRAAAASGARLLLIERLLPARAQSGDHTIMSDLLMLVLEHGRERTEAELHTLLSAAGFDAVRTLSPGLGYAALIEARCP